MGRVKGNCKDGVCGRCHVPIKIKDGSNRLCIKCDWEVAIKAKHGKSKKTY